MAEATHRIAARLGRKGGKTTFARYGREHFVKAALKSHRSRRKNRRKKEQAPAAKRPLNEASLPPET